jgi:hypothetical protein
MIKNDGRTRFEGGGSGQFLVLPQYLRRGVVENHEYQQITADNPTKN